MNILITGATGFIGRHILRSLNHQNHAITACVRDPDRIREIVPGTKLLQVDYLEMTQADDWLPLLAEVDVVINCVGIIGEAGKQTFEYLHSRVPIALFRACQETGVKKIIQISALGSDENANSQYHLSKKAADDVLRDLEVPAAILRPSFVYGEGAASMALFQAIASLPIHVLLDRGRQLVQPVHVDDLVELVTHCISTVECSQELDVVGAQPVSMAVLLSGLRRRLGSRRALQVSVSSGFVIGLARIAEILRVPMLSRENILMLLRGNTASREPLGEVLGHPPDGVEEKLFELPASQADRWHARLYFVRPLLRLSIAFVWLWSGLTSAFFYPEVLSFDLLDSVGITGAAGPLTLYGLSLLDVVIGLLTLFGWKLRPLIVLQLISIFAYSLVVGIALPEFLFHPFGPVLKNLPLLVAIYILLILEEEKV